jgi:hypothetical protein
VVLGIGSQVPLGEDAADVRFDRLGAQAPVLIAVIPPKRFSAELKTSVHASFHLGAAKLRRAQLPAEAIGPNAVSKAPDSA